MTSHTLRSASSSFCANYALRETMAIRGVLCKRTMVGRVNSNFMSTTIPIPLVRMPRRGYMWWVWRSSQWKASLTLRSVYPTILRSCKSTRQTNGRRKISERTYSQQSWNVLSECNGMLRPTSSFPIWTSPTSQSHVDRSFLLPPTSTILLGLYPRWWSQETCCCN